jgi:hypothetical protein
MQEMALSAKTVPLDCAFHVVPPSLVRRIKALVTEEFYDCRKADAGAQHLSSVGVSKLVGDNADGDFDR